MSVIKISRRDFVRISSSASAGLVLGVVHAQTPPGKGKPKAAVTHDLGTFVQVDTDGTVTIWVSKSDMGQDVRTSLPIIVADELDADWKAVKIRQADFAQKFGPMGTGGSASVRTRWTPLRQAGAAARAMLVTAAAARLSVDPASLSVTNGVISHAGSGKKLTFGEVAADAAKLNVPADVKVKEPSQFRIIGRKTNRLDTADIVTGKSVYGIDVSVPGMLCGAVLRSPVFGGRVAALDATKAKAIPGVKDVVNIDSIGTDLPWSGVGVIAASTWAALKGREALQVTWEAGQGAKESTDSLRQQMKIALSRPNKVIDIGNVDTATTSAFRVVEATYELPYLAHATMEPMNATVHVTASGAEIWAPTQFPNWAAGAVAGALKVKPESIKVHVTMLGGGFGRRANPDVVLEAALLSKAAGAPVKVQWTREDDMQHDFYRPASYHHVRAALDDKGSIVAWHHRFAAPPIESYYNAKTEKPHDSEIGGLDDMPYTIPNLRIEFAPIASVVPRGWWRSVEHSINGFVINSMLDEIARASERDPVELRLALLRKGRKIAGEGAAKDYPLDVDRLRRVIELARDKSGWTTEMEPGRGRGFAAHSSFFSYAAQVAEVSVSPDGKVSLERIVCAIDCGTPVNPDGIAAQIEGGIVYGLTAAMGGAITIDKGAVQQSNFHDYPLLRIDEVPVIEVHIVPSTALPTGIGEPGLPPAAPAVANAIFAATGKRLRSLPFKLT
jgi:isoquinoline 1-oxidoreductase beta subunit